MVSLSTILTAASTERQRSSLAWTECWTYDCRVRRLAYGVEDSAGAAVTVLNAPIQSIDVGDVTIAQNIAKAVRRAGGVRRRRRWPRARRRPPRRWRRWPLYRL